MTTAAIDPPLRFAGVPAESWAFGIRIWLAVVVALAASFWLELEVPSAAAVTVAILAEPTRGRALERACFRLIATVIGVTAAIVIVALFSQARDLLLAAFAVWIGLCVYAARVLDGNRAYAAVLSGYSVGIIAIQQIDAPDQVFQSGMERGAAIALVNDLLAAPDSHPQLAARLTALHHRVRDYAAALIRDVATDLTTAAVLLGDIAALRPEIAGLAPESAGGSARRARTTETFTTEPGVPASALRISGSDTSKPASRFTSDRGKSMMRSSAKALPTTTFSDGVPPQSSIAIRVAISSPGTMKAGSTPRSKR